MQRSRLLRAGQPTRRTRPPRTSRPLAAGRALAAFVVGATVLAIAALLSLTSTASAEPPASASAQHAEPPPAKPRVSTSPETLPGAPNRTRTRPDRRASAAEDQPPLTRAAERARIDRMSPSRWLAHFGDVSIERRD